jgi:hypothetical protein
MDASQWIHVVQTVPLQYHENMNIVMQNGVEINIQSFVRLDEDFLVCRGRTMGSTDAGLIFFVPYDQITFMGYCKAMREDTVQSWFMGPSPHAVVPEEPVAAVPVEIPEVEEEPAAAPEPAPTSAPAVAPAPPAAMPAPARPKPVTPEPARRPIAPAAPPQPVAQAMPQGPVSLTSGLALPAKAAMIERLRKRALGPSAHGTTPKPPPEQK